MKKAISSLLVLGLVFSTSYSVKAATAGTSTRLYGKGRVQTAAKIAGESWNGAWKTSKKAVIAPAGDKNLVDALAVSPLAYKLNAPILLNDQKDSISADTLKELKSRAISKVYIATGQGVISDKAVKQLQDLNITVERLGGKNRFETAQNIYNAYKNNGGKIDTIALVSPNALADALSISSTAASEGMPILLTNTEGTDICNDSVSALNSADTIYAVGGTGVIKDELIGKLDADRLGGNDRFETNNEVLKAFAARGKFKFDKVYLANGLNNHLVDALTGSVLAAQSKSPVVLVNDDINSSTAEMLKDNVTKATKVVGFGGNAVINDKIMKRADTIVAGISGDGGATKPDDNKDNTNKPDNNPNNLHVIEVK
ncbi:cell wall-binding repeat-containing protein [Haloimpatiens sp. FM7330]|uniref:cell wall-binding repeat-containing protein n=1 Tax=Haloimpatiens sp. FM7330 TaxID=3298610 RepID=UPI00362AE881